MPKWVAPEELNIWLDDVTGTVNKTKLRIEVQRHVQATALIQQQHID